MSKVEQKIIAAKESRFRFMSPTKLFSKIKNSTNKNFIKCFERDIKSIPRFQNPVPSESLHLLNPLEENSISETHSVDKSEENEVTQLHKIEPTMS